MHKGVCERNVDASTGLFYSGAAQAEGSYLVDVSDAIDDILGVEPGFAILQDSGGLDVQERQHGGHRGDAERDCGLPCGRRRHLSKARLWVLILFQTRQKAILSQFSRTSMYMPSLSKASSNQSILACTSISASDAHSSLPITKVLVAHSVWL